jgi:hypothetical protein
VIVWHVLEPAAVPLIDNGWSISLDVEYTGVAAFGVPLDVGASGSVNSDTVACVIERLAGCAAPSEEFWRP